MRVKLLSDKAKMPTRGSEDSAGIDLYAAEDVTIQPFETAKVHLDIATEIHPCWVALIKDRSSVAAQGIFTVGGVIDADYRGPWAVMFYNSCPDHVFKIETGDKIAQAVVLPFSQAELEQVDELTDTERGSGGFGSTGK